MKCVLVYFVKKKKYEISKEDMDHVQHVHDRPVLVLLLVLLLLLLLVLLLMLLLVLLLVLLLS